MQHSALSLLPTLLIETEKKATQLFFKLGNNTSKQFQMCCGGSSFHHRKRTLFDMFSVPRQSHPDVVSRYIRNISTALSLGEAEGQRALCANDSSIERYRYEQVGKQVFWQRAKTKIHSTLEEI